MMIPTVGAAGVTGCASTVADAGIEMQVLSAVLLTSKLCVPAATPAKVIEAW